MAVGRIEEIRRVRQRQFHEEGEVDSGGDVVGIQRSDHPADNASVLADAALQPAAYEPAVIFGVVASLFGKLRVFLGGLRAAERSAIALGQIAPGFFLVLIPFVCLAVADGDFHRAIHEILPPRCKLSPAPKSGSSLRRPCRDLCMFSRLRGNRHTKEPQTCLRQYIQTSAAVSICQI